MALTKYAQNTNIILNTGTDPEDRPELDDDGFKSKFDENATKWKEFWNDTASVEIDALITAIKGAGWTSESLKGLADLISSMSSVYQIASGDMRNGWTGWVSTYYPNIIKSGKNVTIANGAISCASPAGNQVAFVIPEAYRPSGVKLGTAVCSDKIVAFTVRANGEVFLDTSGIANTPAANQLCFINLSYNIA